MLEHFWEKLNQNERGSENLAVVGMLYIEMNLQDEHLHKLEGIVDQLDGQLQTFLNNERLIFSVFPLLYDRVILIKAPYEDLMIAESYLKQILQGIKQLHIEQSIDKFSKYSTQVFDVSTKSCLLQRSMSSLKDCIRRLGQDGIERHEFIQEFYNILLKRDLHTLFQPIISLGTEKIFAFEALSRGPVNSPFHLPVELFSTAEKEGSLYLLERIAREKALENAQHFLKQVDKLFININAQVIYDEQFTSGFTHSLLHIYNIDASKIVFEITERNAILDFEAFKKVLYHYRVQGFQIAVDDAGAGYSSLQAISELSPDFIKVDRSIVQNIHQHPFKQQVLEMFVNVSKNLGTNVIAEGIETLEELRYIQNIGVQLAQGYLFSKPLAPHMCGGLL